MARITVTDYARRYVRDRAQSHMNCTVVLSRFKRGTLDETTGRYTATTGTVLYTGLARIWSSNTGNVFDVSGTEMSMVSTYCSFPWDVAMPHKDDKIEVVTCPGDADLVGRVFRIIYVDGGGLMTATRKTQIVGQTENRSWDPEAL